MVAGDGAANGHDKQARRGQEPALTACRHATKGLAVGRHLIPEGHLLEAATFLWWFWSRVAVDGEAHRLTFPHCLPSLSSPPSLSPSVLG
ncbi:hypothetical protein ZWY2020_058463 [Hordeum vulgare]|nr:hypothetical protein ZWY2020_058463 [Hordeum vulgare]